MAGDIFYPDVSNLKLRELHRVTEDTPCVIAWCREQGLLLTRRNCHACSGPMMESADAKRRDGVRWRCRDRNCRRDVSIRDGSFFGNGSKLELVQLIDLLYWYSYKKGSCKNLMRECRLARQAIMNWRNYIRDIYAEYFVRHPLRIGGPGHVVEIDESAFVRRKQNAGRVVNTQQWAFGGLDTETHEGFLVEVDRRDANTLLPVLQEYVLPETTIVSDLWGDYWTNDGLRYQHLTTDHLFNFVDPVTYATTNHVKSMWCRAKQRKKYGTHLTLLDTYLVEFMWRQKFGNNPFQKLLEHIREVYPMQ